MTFAIALREAVLLAVFATLGAGPAAWLPGRLSFADRVALAPAFGLAGGACALTTLNFFVPLGTAGWVALLVLGSGSVAVAVRRATWQRPALRPLVALALCGFVVLGIASYPLAKRDSFGPIGYGIFDGPGYAAYIEGYQHNTNRTPIGVSPVSTLGESRWDSVAWGAPWDLQARYGWAFRWQHTGSDTTLAAVSAASDWAPWTLVTPFMAVALAIGAAGAFLLTRRLAPGADVAATIAGVLYCGPLVFQVYIDGSQGLIAGLAVLPAVLFLAIHALERVSWPRTIGVAGMLAGLQAIYPELIPLAGLAGIVLLAGVGIARRRSLDRSSLAVAARHIVAVGVLTLLLAPRTAIFTIDYLTHQLGDRAVLDQLIQYQLPAGPMVAWLTQTRELYSFAFGTDPDSGSVLFHALVPIAALALVLFGLWRRRAGLALLALVAAVALQVFTAATKLDCSYCEQRTVLTLAPILPVLLMVGAAAAWASGRVGRVAAFAVVLLMLIGVGRTLHASEDRTVQAAYLPSPDVAPLADKVRKLPAGTMALEGLDATWLWSWADSPVVYGALRHDSDRRLSMFSVTDDHGGNAYTGTHQIGHASYTPRYEWVLTRFGQLDSGRRVVARQGPYTVERRAGPFDVMVVRGVAADPPTYDRAGQAWVQPPGNQAGLEQGPLTFWLSALRPDRAWIELRLAGPPGTKVVADGVRQTTDAQGVVRACLPVRGRGALREATATVDPAPGPVGVAANRFGSPLLANKTVELQRLRASGSDCRRSLR